MNAMEISNLRRKTAEYIVLNDLSLDSYDSIMKYVNDVLPITAEEVTEEIEYLRGK